MAHLVIPPAGPHAAPARMALLVASALLMAGPAWGGELAVDNPDVSVRWDNTLRYNLGVRAQDIGKIGNNVAYDEGEYRFDKGDVVANRLDLMSEFDFIYRKDFGFRVSAAAWYDHAYRDKKARRNPNIAAGIPGSYVNDQYSSFTKRYYAGPSGEIMDAFVFGKVDLGDMPLSFKAGRHTVFWGESLLLGGALHGVSYAQMPIDLAKGFATPGSEAKELFRPLSNLSAQLQVLNTLSLSGQYFLDWDSFRYPEGGTFMGPGDFAFTGPQQQQSALGLVQHGGVHRPKERGDFGLAARWSPEWLDGTMGFYYRNYTDKLLGLLISNGATPAKANPLGLQYSQFYARDVDLLGISLGKQVGPLSVGAELSYRHNTPLNTQTLGLTPGAMAGPLAALVPFLFPRGAAAVKLDDNSYQARGNTYHLVLNTLGLLPKNAVFDAGSYIAELTYSRLGKVTANHDMYFGEGYGVCSDTLRNPALPAAVRNQFKDKWDGCATRDALGLALNVTPTWFQVLPGVDLGLPLTWSKTLRGNAPVVLGGNQGNGNFSIGLSADAYQKYRIDLKYQAFFGKAKEGIDPISGLPAVTTVNGLSTLLRDRGQVALTLKTTF